MYFILIVDRMHFFSHNKGEVMDVNSLNWGGPCESIYYTEQCINVRNVYPGTNAIYFAIYQKMENGLIQIAYETTLLEEVDDSLFVEVEPLMRYPSWDYLIKGFHIDENIKISTCEAKGKVQELLITNPTIIFVPVEGCQDP